VSASPTFIALCSQCAAPYHSRCAHVRNQIVVVSEWCERCGVYVQGSPECRVLDRSDVERCDAVRGDWKPVDTDPPPENMLVIGWCAGSGRYDVVSRFGHQYCTQQHLYLIVTHWVELLDPPIPQPVAS
jgi:hypothetical protein